MRRLAIVILLGIAAASAQKPMVGRLELVAMEKSFDDRLKRFSIDYPLEILGLTRGIYLEGYGAVFTAEVNLLQTPGVSPFRPEFTDDEKSKIRATKVQRIPAVRQMMKSMLVASAQSLDRVPPEEQIGIALFLFSKPWEDKTGLPQQILMQGKRKALLDIAMNRVDKSALDSLIQERTY